MKREIVLNADYLFDLFIDLYFYNRFVYFIFVPFWCLRYFFLIIFNPFDFCLDIFVICMYTIVVFKSDIIVSEFFVDRKAGIMNCEKC